MSLNKKWATGFGIFLGVSYPFLIYFGLDILNPTTIVVILVLLALLRLFLNKNKTALGSVIIVGSVALVVLLLSYDGLLAVKAYPVAVSLGLAFGFIWSLFYPPSAIERIARLTEPNLNAHGVGYTRKVTICWIMFFVVNAVISSYTALYTDLATWTLYNGFISYVLMGLLFSIEFIVRYFVKRRHA